MARDFEASSMNTANSKMRSGSEVFFAFERYNASVCSCERREALSPGWRCDWSRIGGDGGRGRGML